MDILMPQMGESIATGTITKWLRAPGEKIGRDETLFEIATDKVDAEIPSPAAGVIAEILVPEGATVDVGTVVARLSTGDAAPGAGAAAGANGGAKAGGGKPASTAPAAPAATPARGIPPAPSGAAHFDVPATAAASAAGAAPVGELFASSARGIASLDELRRRRSTPVVRAIAEKHGIALGQVPGTGASGRVTKRDILSFLESGSAVRAAAPVAAPAVAVAAAPVPLVGGAVGPFAFNPSLHPLGPSPYPTHGPNDEVEITPMTKMRSEIAKHMVASLAFSAHVTQFIEVDFTAVDRARARMQPRMDQKGVKLTYTPFILQASARALQQFPHFNSSVDGSNLVRKKRIHLGMAVALDWGLIVPVIRDADELNLTGLARASTDLAVRARDKKLKPDEVQGGTFTVTNPGIFGALTGTPVINQPQVAILGAGVIEKRVAVVDDAIAIRKRAYFSLTIDHRVLDGADGARFLKFVKDYLEAGEFGEA